MDNQSRVDIVAQILRDQPGISQSAISAITGIPRSSVQRAIVRLNKEEQSKQQSRPFADIAKRKAESKHSDLQAKYNEALKIIEQLQRQLTGFTAIPSTPTLTQPILLPKADKREVVPVIVASDWHIEETVSAAITNGMNEYNPEIAEKSAVQFFANAAVLVNQTKQNSTVNTVVVAVLGDIINGVLRDEDLQNNSQTSIEAVTAARSMLYRGLKSLAESTGCNIRVICCVGNHGRLTGKIFPSNQVHNSLEYLLYKTLQRDFRDHPKIDVIVSEASYYIQDIFGVRIRFHHGHTFKFFGGIGGLAVPVLRKISQLNLIEKADLDVCGHFHSMQVFNNCILNGSLVGANGYSMQLGIPFEPPRQTFFLIDSKYGRSVVAPIFIDREVGKQKIDSI